MLNSRGEEIMVYLISNNDDKSEEDQGNDGENDEEGEGEEDKDSFLNFANQIQNKDAQDTEKPTAKISSTSKNKDSNKQPEFEIPEDIDNIFSASNMFNTDS